MLKPEIEIMKSRARKRIEDAVGVTNWTQSSVARMLLEMPIEYLSDLWRDLEFADRAGRVDTAVGTELDAIGEMFNIRRLPPYTATSQGQGPTVKFWNGALGSITAPAGTRVWPSESPERSFLTISDVTIPGGGEGYADVRATGVGPFYNVGPGTIDSHNYPNTSLHVTNVMSISNGSFEEDDGHYRARIHLALSILQGGTEAAIRDACLRVPGVKDAIINKYSKGTRTLDVLLLTMGATTPETLGAAQANVDEVVAYGIDARVMGPTEKQVDVVVVLKLNSLASLTDVRTAVTTAISSYIDNLPIEVGGGEGTIYFNELVSRVMDASGYILDADIILRIDGQRVLQTNCQINPGERFTIHNVSVS